MFANRYNVTTAKQPIRRARGRFLPGSRTSPPVNVTLFHALCAKSGPTIAHPRNIVSAETPATVRSGRTAFGSQPLAHGFHHEEVCAALSAFQPAVRPKIIRAAKAAVFVTVNVF